MIMGLCEGRGYHLVHGLSNGVGDEVWAPTCQDCETRFTAPFSIPFLGVERYRGPSENELRHGGGDEHRRDHLLTGLIGDVHVQQYLHDANFKSAVDILVQLLPMWVEGLSHGR